jgi:hypothetical protein
MPRANMARASASSTAWALGQRLELGDRPGDPRLLGVAGAMVVEVLAIQRDRRRRVAHALVDAGEIIRELGARGELVRTLQLSTRALEVARGIRRLRSCKRAARFVDRLRRAVVGEGVDRGADEQDAEHAG